MYTRSLFIKGEHKIRQSQQNTQYRAGEDQTATKLMPLGEIYRKLSLPKLPCKDPIEPLHRALSTEQSLLRIQTEHPSRWLLALRLVRRGSL